MFALDLLLGCSAPRCSGSRRCVTRIDDSDGRPAGAMSFIEEVEVAAASPPTAIAADGFSRVFYRSAPNQPLQPVGTRAYIKLVFDNIGRATP